MRNILLKRGLVIQPPFFNYANSPTQPDEMLFRREKVFCFDTVQYSEGGV